MSSSASSEAHGQCIGSQVKDEVDAQGPSEKHVALDETAEGSALRGERACPNKRKAPEPSMESGGHQEASKLDTIWL